MLIINFKYLNKNNLKIYLYIYICYKFEDDHKILVILETKNALKFWVEADYEIYGIWYISRLHNNEESRFVFYNAPSVLESFIDMLKLEFSNNYNFFHMFDESFNILFLIFRESIYIVTV